MRTGGWRRGAAGGALLCHLLTAFGFPTLAPPAGESKDTSRPFPCQSRPCGCRTSVACWAGDCCCFTLEEKLRWAEENGIEPPDHVRPLVESRKARPAPPKRKKSCCAEAEPAPAPTPACCAKRESAKPACCAEKPARAVSTATDGPHGTAEVAAKCPEQKAPPEDRSVVRWVAGVFAQKCRGEGPAGLFQLDPGIAPDLTPIRFPEPERPFHPAPRSDRATPTSHRPPTPPPRPF